MTKEEKNLQIIQGARVRHVREMLKLTQKQFATEIGIKQPALAGIETGHIKLTQRNSEIICRVYKVNPEWLQTGVGEKFKPAREETFLDKLAEEMKLSFRHKALLQSIIDLPPATREAVIDWALDFAEKITEEEIRLENETELKRRELLKQRHEIDAQLLELDDAEKNNEKESVLDEAG